MSRLEEPQTIAMSQKSRDLADTGVNVISLALGEPDFDTPEHIRAAAITAIEERYSHYTPIPGYVDLRKAVCEKLLRDNQLTYTPDQIVVGTGAKQCIANLLLSLVGPGDEVIVPTPYWVTYTELVELAEATSVQVATTVESGFKLSAAQLEDAITPRTKAFIFSSPNNPTGAVYTQDELAQLAEVFARYPYIYIISDEIYELINFEGTHATLASFPAIKDRVAVVNGLSKGYAMTGWRLGYLAAPLWWAKGAALIQAQFTSGACAITQRAAITALLGTQAPSHAMTAEFKRRRDKVAEWLKEIPEITFGIPPGAFYFFPRVDAYYGRKTPKGDTINNSTDLSLYLLAEGHVATVAGNAFGDDTCIRLSYAASMPQLEDALGRLKNAFAALV